MCCLRSRSAGIRTFFFWNALGGITWGVTFGLVGYFGGEAGSRVLERFGLVGAIVLVAMFIASATYIVIRERRGAAAEDRDEEPVKPGSPAQD